MQVMLLVLAIVGSSAWIAFDAAQRDWTDVKSAKSVQNWVVASLMLWPFVLLLYVFKYRKEAPLRTAAATAPTPVPAAAMSAPRAEQYGPSLDEVQEVEVVSEPEPEPEPVVAVELDPVVEFVSEPEPEPVVAVEPEPVVAAEPEPVVETASEPELNIEPEPEPVAVAPDAEPVIEISHPIADEAPPGLSVDAFRDIKPVAFGGFVPDADEPQPEPVIEPEPVAAEPEPVAVEPEPVAVEPEASLELSYPVDTEPVIEIEPEPVAFEPEPVAFEPEPEPAVAAMAPEPEMPRKRGLRLPNPEIKLPNFGRKNATAAASAAPAEPKPKKTGLRLPNPQLKLPKLTLSRKPKEASDTSGKKSFLTLPENLQGPLNDVERKIAIGSVVAVVAAAALGYMTAPSDGAAAPTPPPAPAAASR